MDMREININGYYEFLNASAGNKNNKYEVVGNDKCV